MERSGLDHIELDDTAEEITRAGSEWPVPEEYRIDASSPEPSETTLLAATTSSSRRLPLRAGIPLVAALALLASIVLIPLLASPPDRASETAPGKPRAGASLGGVVAPTPRRQSQAAAASRVLVPAVTDASLAAARRALGEAGLRAKTRLVESDRPAGIVLEQEPEPGDRIARRSAVVLVVSREPSTPRDVEVSVPDVVGLRADRAARLARREGLRVEIRFVRASERAGIVVAQRPVQGRLVSHGAVVELRVARTRVEVSTVRVPRVEGMPLAVARARLKDSGLRWSVEEVTSSKGAGIVLGQSERSGAVVAKGTRVTLEVSSGPQLRTVPDVVGLDVVLARQQLEAAGLVALVTESPTSDPAKDGIVLDQSPGSGTRLAEGAEVTLSVGLAG